MFDSTKDAPNVSGKCIVLHLLEATRQLNLVVGHRCPQ